MQGMGTGIDTGRTFGGNDGDVAVSGGTVGAPTHGQGGGGGMGRISCKGCRRQRSTGYS